MHFSTYLQPLLSWLHNHPQWALLITFLISFSESLAIVGSIIPGSVTMTAIGMLAGAEIMRLDLTLLSATLGAIAGDSASYILGYLYSEQLLKKWPIKKYPNLIHYGKEYFAKHGGKSVLLGRFIGPLRSIIPLIAGMMHMRHWRFFLANLFSGILWSLLYILPGYFIALASTSLSPEAATRRFLFVLAFLGILWLLTRLFRWFFSHLKAWIKQSLDRFWRFGKNQRLLRPAFVFLTPDREKKHVRTAGLFLLCLLCFFAFIGLLLFSQSPLATKSNQLVFLFFESLRMPNLDIFFIIIEEIFNLPSLFIFVLFSLSLMIYYQDRSLLKIALSLLASLALSLAALNTVFLAYWPSFLFKNNFYPFLIISSSVTLFSFFLLYLLSFKVRIYHYFIFFIFLILFFAAGLSFIYFGDAGYIDILAAYFLGLAISLFHWLLYRRNPKPAAYSKLSSFFVFLSLVLSTALFVLTQFTDALEKHPSLANLTFLPESTWWQQDEPLLPIYRLNRIGVPIHLFNVQYVGDLTYLEQTLTAKGWKNYNPSFFEAFFASEEPLFPALKAKLKARPLYLNKKPVLVFLYTPRPPYASQILRLWGSNYYLQGATQDKRIWIGSLHALSIELTKNKKLSTEEKLNFDILSCLYQQLPASLDKRLVPLPPSLLPTKPGASKAQLLLIKEKDKLDP